MALDCTILLLRINLGPDNLARLFPRLSDSSLWSCARLCLPVCARARLFVGRCVYRNALKLESLLIVGRKKEGAECLFQDSANHKGLN